MLQTINKVLSLKAAAAARLLVLIRYIKYVYVRGHLENFEWQCCTEKVNNLYDLVAFNPQNNNVSIINVKYGNAKKIDN